MTNGGDDTSSKNSCMGKSQNAKMMKNDQAEEQRTTSVQVAKDIGGKILDEQKAKEEALAEEARKAAALKAAEQAQQSLANPRRTEGEIVSGELPPAQPSQDDDISPTLRESIIQNIEDFLGQN